MSKNTPGPFDAQRALTKTDDAYDYGIFAVIDERRVCIAEAFGRVATDLRPDARANAVLFAAAPDLLATCQEMLRTFDTRAGRIVSDITRSELEPWLPMLRAAIAKAQPPT